MADPVASSSFGWSYYTTKVPLTGIQFWKKDDKVVAVTLPAGTVLRVYQGKVEYPTMTVTSPSPQNGDYFVETAPDAKSVGWTTYPNEPRYAALMTSAEYKDEDAAKARLDHMLWVPLKMAGEEKPDLVDAAKEAQLNDLYLAPLPDGFKGTDNGSGGNKPEATNSVLLAVGIGIGAALLLSMYTRSKK